MSTNEVVGECICPIKYNLSEARANLPTNERRAVYLHASILYLDEKKNWCGIAHAQGKVLKSREKKVPHSCFKHKTDILEGWLEKGTFKNLL